jgi:hypothetical protein
MEDVAADQAAEADRQFFTAELLSDQTFNHSLFNDYSNDRVPLTDFAKALFSGRTLAGD